MLASDFENRTVQKTPLFVDTSAANTGSDISGSPPASIAEKLPQSPERHGIGEAAGAEIVASDPTRADDLGERPVVAIGERTERHRIIAL